MRRFEFTIGNTLTPRLASLDLCKWIKRWGKCKEHTLDTDERKLAEWKLKSRIANLDKVDDEVGQTTPVQLLEKFETICQGR
jgi:hypothetical protein